MVEIHTLEGGNIMWEELGGIAGAVVALFIILLAVLWVLVPLAVFGCYRELKAMREYQRTMLVDHLAKQRSAVEPKPEGRRSVVA